MQAHAHAFAASGTCFSDDGIESTPPSVVQRKTDIGRLGPQTASSGRDAPPDFTPIEVPLIGIPPVEAPAEHRQVVSAGLEMTVRMRARAGNGYGPAPVLREELLEAAPQATAGWRTVAQTALTQELRSSQGSASFDHYLSENDHRVFIRWDHLAKAVSPALKAMGHSEYMAECGYDISGDARIVGARWKARRVRIDGLAAGMPSVSPGTLEVLVTQDGDSAELQHEAIENLLRGAVDALIVREKERFDAERAASPDDETMSWDGALEHRVRVALRHGEALAAIGGLVDFEFSGLMLQSTTRTIEHVAENALRDSSDMADRSGLAPVTIKIPPSYHVALGGSARRVLLGVQARTWATPDVDLHGVSPLTFGPFVSAIASAMGAAPDAAAEIISAAASDLGTRMRSVFARVGDNFRGFSDLGLTVFVNQEESEPKSVRHIVRVVGPCDDSEGEPIPLSQLPDLLVATDHDEEFVQGGADFIGEGSLIAATAARADEYAYEVASDKGMQGVFSTELVRELAHGEGLEQATIDVQDKLRKTNFKQNPQLIRLLASTSEDSPSRKPRSVHIGNDAYPTAPLNGAVNDATNLAGVYRSRGYAAATTFNVPASGIRSAFSSVVGGAVRGDRIALSFAGHGREGGGLVGVDLDDMPWSDVASYGTAAVAKGAHFEIVLDACHSGTVARSIEESVNRAVLGSRAADSGRVRALRETMSYVGEAVRTMLSLPASYWNGDGVRRYFEPQLTPLLEEAGLATSAFGEALRNGAQALKRWHEQARLTLGDSLRKALAKQTSGGPPRGTTPVPAGGDA